MKGGGGKDASREVRAPEVRSSRRPTRSDTTTLLSSSCRVSRAFLCRTGSRLRVRAEFFVALRPASSLSSVDTVYSADSLEFSPHHPSIFAVGTYQLEKPVEEGGQPADDETAYDDEGNMKSTPAAKRRGRCLMYETDGQALYVSPLLNASDPSLQSPN